MVDPNWADFWWTNITGANMVVTEVSSALLENKMVVLEVPNDLPWRYHFRTAIEFAFRKNANSESYVVQIVDDADECGQVLPGDFIITRFSKSREVRNGYRSAARKTIQDYIIHNKVLCNSIVYVKGLDDKRAKEWLKFCRGFKSDAIENGLFVLEINESTNMGDSKSEAYVCYSNYVSSYDLQLFCSLMLSEGCNISPNWKRYISTLAASLCDTDAEISAELLDKVDLRNAEPDVGLEKIESTGEFVRRGGSKNSDHILRHFRRNNINEIQKRIWSAQLQVLFPLIEMERAKYIDAYYDEIGHALESENIYQFDEIIYSPNDVELGTLDFLVRKNKIRVALFGDKERIAFLRDCRNKIAHMNCCSANDICTLING